MCDFLFCKGLDRKTLFSGARLPEANTGLGYGKLPTNEKQLLPLNLRERGGLLWLL